MSIVIKEDERGMSYYLCSGCGKPVIGLPFVVFCDSEENCTGHGYCPDCEGKNNKKNKSGLEYPSIVSKLKTWLLKNQMNKETILFWVVLVASIGSILTTDDLKIKLITIFLFVVFGVVLSAVTTLKNYKKKI